MARIGDGKLSERCLLHQQTSDIFYSRGGSACDFYCMVSLVGIIHAFGGSPPSPFHPSLLRREGFVRAGPLPWDRQAHCSLFLFRSASICASCLRTWGATECAGSEQRFWKPPACGVGMQPENLWPVVCTQHSVLCPAMLRMDCIRRWQWMAPRCGYEAF